MGIYNSAVGAMTRKMNVHFVEERNRIHMMGIQWTYRRNMENTNNATSSWMREIQICIGYGQPTVYGILINCLYGIYHVCMGYIMYGIYHANPWEKNVSWGVSLQPSGV